MKLISNTLLLSIFLWVVGFGTAFPAQNPGYWQQKVHYKMDINMDVANHQFKGKQTLKYTNNSPDTLHRVFYHLYFNAFQPGSMMDIRSLNISDPDKRVGDRISKLKEDEIGYQKINKLKQDGKAVAYEVSGTILEVDLARPILPGGKTTFVMDFEAQVPLQIRRSGWQNKEGIEYSMAQWYPKISEYDFQGWHANPYIGREFHGVWGDFDVKISIDTKYIVAATGHLQNANKIGYGYEEEGTTVNKPKKKKLTWHFKAENVHDFVWAADPDYQHVITQVPDGPTLHFFYQKNEKTAENWSKLPDMMSKAFQFANKTFGKYPHSKYSFIQGGDGGMEYPMATLITGERSFPSLVGVSVHEMFHSWYQGALATNESLHPWIDEGFTSYASDITMQYLGLQNSRTNASAVKNYLSLVRSKKAEPLTTHADHYQSNFAYGVNAYNKGALFLGQLGYITGQETMMSGLRRFFKEWQGKHPTPNDFMRIMEKVSGMELDWYFEQWTNSTNNIDYAFGKVRAKGNSTLVDLERLGEMMMPLDVTVTYQDGSSELYYIPLRMMRGEKAPEDTEIKRTIADDWPWTYPGYTLEINRQKADIKKMVIDASQRMVDIDRKNNELTLTK